MNEYDIGKGRPPKDTRWKKGTTGNPKGRPKGSTRELPYEAVLGQMVTVRTADGERRMRADEAFVQHVMQNALTGDASYTDAALKLTASAKKLRPEQKIRRFIYSVYPDLGDPNHGMRGIGMATLMDPYRPTAYMALEPWLVQAALDRLDGRELTVEEQKTVRAATRSPHKVRWPEWWSEHGD